MPAVPRYRGFIMLMPMKHSLSPAQRRAFDSQDAAVSTPGLAELRDRD
jgi:hypothetical protein